MMMIMLIHILSIINASCSGRSVTKYNILTGERSSLPSLPEPVNQHACTIYNGHLVVSGGYIGRSILLDKVLRLEGNQWVELPSLQKPRYVLYFIKHLKTTFHVISLVQGEGEGHFY